MTEIAEGYQQTEVGLIPIDWEATLLDSVAKRGSGHTPNKKHPEYWDGDIKWISLRDSDRLDALYIYDTAAKITPAGIANSSAVLHPKGTVVLSRDAGVGKSSITADVMAVSQHFMAWQCGSQLDNHFLYYWLQAKKSEFERIAIGNTIKTIGLPYFKQLKIPLPPLPEQKAIAQALSDADAAIAELDRLITKKRNIKQGTMQQLLTGKKRLPGFSGEWEVKTLEEVSKLSSGTTPSRKLEERYYLNGNIHWVKTADLNNSVINYTEEKITELALNETCLRKYDIGTVLVAMYGGFNQIGRTGLLRIAATVNQALIAIQPQHQTLNPTFLINYLNFQVCYWKNIAISSRKDPNITSRDVKNFPIALPSLPEQKAIAQVLTDMDTEIEALEQKRDKYKAIKQGMMQELLTGRTRLV
jgi:type I restriction enzyme S subunit